MEDTPTDKSHPLTRRTAFLREVAPAVGGRGAVQQLAAALRRINHALASTNPNEEQTFRAVASIEQLADEFEGLQAESLARNEDGQATFDRNPVLGFANPVAPPVVLRVDGDTIRGSVTFGEAYEGPRGFVHGGFIAAAFDEALGMVQALSGNPGVTGTLTVRYRQPTPLHVELAFIARVERVEGRKIYTSATVHAGDRLCAEAEGIFISVGTESFRGPPVGRP